MFFSEEKNQKTFMFCAHGKIPAMASIVGVAEKQKSFASFLQKRRPFFLSRYQFCSPQICNCP
jgi:hypothetical protein